MSIARFLSQWADLLTSGGVVNGTLTSSGTLSSTGNAYSAINALTDGATITPNFSTGNDFSVTLGGNRTFANPTSPTAGQSGVFYISQDGTGGRTLTWGSYYKFPAGAAPTLSTAANACDAIFYTVRTTTSITVNSVLNIA